MEWIGVAHIQIGAYDAPPPAQLSPFLAGLVDGLGAHAAVRGAELLDIDPLSAEPQLRNPTRHVRFRFLADSYRAAERLADDELRDAGFRAGVAALEPGQRRFGWMISVDVEPA